MKISVIGLGKLGACYAAFYADHGFSVIGSDSDKKKVSLMNRGLPPVHEPHLAEYITRNTSRIRATTDVKEAVSATDVSFVIVPTPSLKNKSFSLEYILNACTAIGTAIKEKDTYHLVSLVSTILPEDSRNVIIPALEKISGKKCGPDFGYSYNPSLIALGDVIENLEKPDLLFIGAFDKRSDMTLRAIYKKIYPDKEPERMSIESVEIAKIALNSYVTTKITFANVLGELCSKIEYADVDEVTRALGKDTRIGSRYLSSGLGFGGPCFPRDNGAFAYATTRRGVKSPLALAVDSINNTIPKKISQLLEKHAKTTKHKRIGFLGVSYKPKTTVTERSQALDIALTLSKKGYTIYIYEPISNRDIQNRLGNNARYPKNLESLVSSCDIIFVSNRDKAFDMLHQFANTKKETTIIIDPWRMFKTEVFKPHVVYHPIGRHQ